uniref:Uncharacterized protein n=1 Tax=Lactuca sativa TaxID=4236 RepID=A0A9R1UK36_LACSA|nr:hypothetical protein LSAT_V11C900480180 [Lactuca sativa]
MLRDFTGQRDMVRPAKTRFATTLITLNCFRIHKASLKKLFTSDAWNKSRFKCERKLAMGYIYEAMDRAKEQIAYSFNNKFNKYKAFFKIIDDGWNCQFHQHLHVTGHYLNSNISYNNPRVKEDSEVIKSLMKSYLAQHMAVKLRTTLAQEKWWMQYGSSAPTLKKFVVKIHLKKRNRLERQKLNDLVYIKYSQALRRGYDMRDMIDRIILEDSHIYDPFEWLASDDDGLVFEGDDLRWYVVADAMGVDEPVHRTRRTTTRKGLLGLLSRAHKGEIELVFEEDEDNN